MTDMGQPIAALATPEGCAPLAVLRLSGPGVWAALATLMERPLLRAHEPAHQGHAPGARPWVAQAVDLRWDPLRAPVPGVVLLYPPRRSYTAEESAEVYLPAAPPIVDGLLAQLLRQGVVAAGPGEFTRRAFEQGRLDLTQAEAVAQLIAAEDHAAAVAARRSLDGELGGRIRMLGEALHDQIALLEAGLDFADQEVLSPATEEIAEALAPINAALDELLAGSERFAGPTARVRILLAGQPNAGKSTLFNALVGEDRSLATPWAGTTRDPVAGLLQGPGLPPCEVVDLAGAAFEGLWRDLSQDVLSPAAGSPDALAQQASQRWVRDGSLVLYLLDAVRPLAELLAEWRRLDPGRLEWEADRRGPGAEVWPVLSRCDLVPDARALAAEFASASARPAILCAALAPDGTAALRDALCAFVGRGSWVSRGAASLFTQRQIEGLHNCRAILVRLGQSLVSGALGPLDAPGLTAPELVALELREAHASLSEVTGELCSEATLDRIFARFCLGK